MPVLSAGPEVEETWAAEELESLRIGDLVIDGREGSVSVAGRPVALRPRELELLKFLAANPNRVFSRDSLLFQVWGSEFGAAPRTVDVYIRRLRGSLGEFGRRHLQTVSGVGYRMAAPGTGGVME